MRILLEAAVVQSLLLQVPLPVEEFAACADNISGNIERTLLLVMLNLQLLYYQKYSAAVQGSLVALQVAGNIEHTVALQKQQPYMCPFVGLVSTLALLREDQGYY